VVLILNNWKKGPPRKFAVIILLHSILKRKSLFRHV
jgi:hypothetical protein